MFNKFWNWLVKIVSGNSVGMTDAGHYLYVGASSGGWNMANTSELGEDQDDQVFRVDHAGGDAAILTFTCQGSDRFYEPSITGALGQGFGTGGTTGQTRTTLQMVKGDSAFFTHHGRVWFWTIVRPLARAYTMLAADTAYTAKPYDNLILMNTSTNAQTVNLPPATQFWVNGEGRGLVVKLLVGANAGTVAANGSDTIEGAASVGIASAGGFRTLRATSSTTWGLF
jgi:hypothetical protein